MIESLPVPETDLQAVQSPEKTSAVPSSQYAHSSGTTRPRRGLLSKPQTAHFAPTAVLLTKEKRSSLKQAGGTP